MMLIIPTFLGFSRTALRTQIDGSTIFHWTYFHEMYYGNFALKQEVQYSKNFWLWKFLPKSQWLLWKSKIKYLDWVFASSNVQQTERLLNFVQSIEWIVNIKVITNIEWVPNFKGFSKNIWSAVLEKHLTRKVLIEAHLNLFLNNQKILLLQTGEILIDFWWRYHRSHFVSAK